VLHSAIQPCALWTGATRAKALGSCGDTSSWIVKADTALCSLQSFRNSGHFAASNIDPRFEHDANSVLIRTHPFDPAAGCEAVTFRPSFGPGARKLARPLQAFWGRAPARRRRGRRRADRGLILSLLRVDCAPQL
jgi:hypothetical protein